MTAESLDPRPLAYSVIAVAPPRLEGHGVALEPLRLDHVEPLVVAATESREFYGYNPVPNGYDETHDYVAVALDRQARGERMPFVVWWSGRIVGSTSYYELQPWRWPAGSPSQRTDRPDAVEIGSTWLAASAIGTTCNVTAKLLMLAHAFDVWDVCRVSFRTDVRNVRSRRAIETLGATFEGVRRNHLPGFDDTIRDSAFYSILDSEWPDVRTRLLHRLEVRSRIQGRDDSSG